MDRFRYAGFGALAVLTSLAALPRSATAYEINTSSAGDPLRWLGPKIEVGLDLAGAPAQIPVAEAERAGALAFRPWAARLAAVFEVEVRPERGAGDGGAFGDRQSDVRWILEDWERDFAPAALAVTLVTYRVQNGEILEADVAVNGGEYDWSASEAPPESCHDLYDLQNVLTHEAGHFFGLGHAGEDREATMYPKSAACETDKRSLAADDVAGLLALYDGATHKPPQPGEGADTGDDRSGEGPAEEPLSYGCSAARGSGAPGATLCLLLLFFAISPLCRRRGASLLLALAAASLPLSSADASVARALSVDELTTRAAAVVRAEVIVQRTVRLGGLIYTDSTVRVTECWKGPCPEKTVLRQLGGEHLGVGMRVAGQAPIATGDQLVLFLRSRRDGTVASLGMAQGVFFEAAAAGAEVSLVRDLAGLSLVGGDGHRAEVAERIGLAALRREVARKLPK